MSDLISVIIPIYNASKYLNQCMESVLRQTYRELEIILINDGSTDDSLSICEKYQKADKRIKVISQKNQGSVGARKAGLRLSKGAYIGFVDADDFIEPNMFEMLYIKMKEFDVDFVHSGLIIDDKKFCEYQESIVDFTLLDRASYMSENIFKNQIIFFALWSKLFKASLVRDAYMRLPNEQSYGEDLLCLCHYMSECNKIYLLKDAFYHYRIYEGSMSHLNWIDTCIEESKLHSYVIKILEKNGILRKCNDSARYHYGRRVRGTVIRSLYNGENLLRYKCSNMKMLNGKKVALYGAGKVGRDFYWQIFQNSQCEIVGWIDKEKYGETNLINICKPVTLKKIDYDILLLAVKSKTVADEIKAELIRDNICKDDSLILWEEPICLW